MYRRPDMTAVLVLALLHVCALHALPVEPLCEVPALTESGWVCGMKRLAEDGSEYASFRGVPYAKQPLGELRFKELEPAEPWSYLNTTTEGPICPQVDKLYGRLMKPQGVSEACIHANIHVPMEALPSHAPGISTELQPPFLTSDNPSNEYILPLSTDLEPPFESPYVAIREKRTSSPGLPIFVFIHGGGFAFGSGDSDLHGPEYLVSKKMIVITFNYRLNVFGFLSMGTSKIPGNAGLRDMVTLLRWVQRNAKSFGGDPDNVTLGGQSAGAMAAHLLTLSKPAENLFKRAILMSGTGISSFVSTSPAYAQYLSKQLLTILNITSTDPDEIHKQLIELPAEKLIEANALIINSTGLTTFVPVIETPVDGITPIVDNDPDILLAEGRGKDVPLVVGYTNAECESFRQAFEAFDIVSKIKQNPALMVPPKTIFKTPQELLPKVIDKLENEYYHGTINIDNFLQMCTDAYYKYHAIKLVEERTKTEGGAPVFLYKFSYGGENSVVKQTFGLNYTGAGHVEDLTYIFKANSILDIVNSRSSEDQTMINWMTEMIRNFSGCSNLNCNGFSWEAAEPVQIQYQNIDSTLGDIGRLEPLSEEQHKVLNFFDSLSSANEETTK